MKKTKWLVVASVWIGAVACGDTQEPTIEDYDDVAAAVAPLVVGEDGDEEAMADAVLAALGELRENFSSSGDGTLTGERGSIEYSYAIECRSEDGEVQEECSTLTDAADVTANWAGDIETDRYDVKLDRRGSWSLSGISGDVVTFDGIGTYDVGSEFMSFDGNRERSMVLSYAATYEGVRFDKDALRAVGGQATFLINAERTASNRVRDAEAAFEIDAVVEFSADGPTLTLDGFRTYELNVEVDGSVEVVPPEA